MEKKIILIGERCLDINQYVNVTRINPEAPTPVMVPVGQDIQDGMAGNVYNNLVSLGLSPNNIITFFPIFDIIKRRFIDKNSGYIMLRLDENDEIKDEDAFSEADKAKVITLIEGGEVDAIVVSDYGKGFLSEDKLSDIFYRASQYEVPTFLDTKKILGNWSFWCFCVKINAIEFERHREIEAGANLARNLLVTRGGDGIESIYARKIYPTDSVEVINVCGAGDSALAGLVYKYIETKDLNISIKFANKVAGAAVTKRGTYAVTQKDLKND